MRCENGRQEAYILFLLHQNRLPDEKMALGTLGLGREVRTGTLDSSDTTFHVRDSDTPFATCNPVSEAFRREIPRDAIFAIFCIRWSPFSGLSRFFSSSFRQSSLCDNPFRLYPADKSLFLANLLRQTHRYYLLYPLRSIGSIDMPAIKVSHQPPTPPSPSPLGSPSEDVYVYHGREIPKTMVIPFALLVFKAQQDEEKLHIPDRQHQGVFLRLRSGA